MEYNKQCISAMLRKCKDKGLKYWSAKDFLKNHRTMTPII